MNDTQESDEYAVLGTIMGGTLDHAQSTLAASMTLDAGGLELFDSEWSCEVWRRVKSALDANRPPISMMPVKVVEDIPPEVTQRLFNEGVPIDLIETVYLPALVKTARERKIRRLMKQAAEGGDVDQALTKCQSLAAKEKTQKTNQEVYSEIISEWETAFQHPGQISGIPTGLIDLDNLTWGWQNGNLIIIGARPSQGKTALLIGFARTSAIDNDIPTLFITLESSHKEIWRRLLCQVTKANQTELRGGTASERDMVELVKTQIHKKPLWVNDMSGFSITAIKASARNIIKSYGIKLVIVDYLQKIKPAEKHEKRTYEVAQASEGLKDIAKEMNVPVISAAQLNREPEKQKGRSPMLSDLADSGQIERDADVIGLIYRKVNPENGVPDYKLLVSKFRDGPTGSVRMTFLDQCARFDNAPKFDNSDYNSPTKDP